jgi:hypothetical protein
MSNPNYQFVYNVNLLDDLHNYFPALLYDAERFQNVREVLRYIRDQTHTRFNLFSYGRNLYNERDPPLTPPIHPQPPIMRTFTPREDEVVDSMATTNFLLSMLGANMNNSPFLGARLLQRNLLNPNADPFTPRTIWGQNFLNPVVVRPTQEQIENNSEIVTDISGQSCAICQDQIRSDDTCRSLSTCQHVYHRTCIDQWFTRSVQCPTCRHDIRDRDLQPRRNL